MTGKEGESTGHCVNLKMLTNKQKKNIICLKEFDAIDNLERVNYCQIYSYFT